MKVAGSLEADYGKDDENEDRQEDAQEDAGRGKNGERCEDDADGIECLCESLIFHVSGGMNQSIARFIPTLNCVAERL